MQQRRRTLGKEVALPVAVDRKALANFVASFPFRNSAQTRAIESIVADFEKTHRCSAFSRVMWAVAKLRLQYDRVSRHNFASGG